MNQPDPAPIRKSLLPCTPPPEWEFHTWFPHPDGGGDMVRGERQRGILVRRCVTYGDWQPVRPDRWADEPETDVQAADPAAQSPADQAAEELAKHVTRAIFALKSPPPPGSQHYRSGWDDGLEAAIDAARDVLLRRLAGEQPTQNEARLCGKTRGVDGSTYRPCARTAGHREAYCRSADGEQLFIAAQPMDPVNILGIDAPPSV